jgi:integrase
MGRHAEGWKIVWRDGIAHVRFRHQGRRYDFSTGERAEGEARAKAAEIYAQVVAGQLRSPGKPHGLTSLVPLVDLVAKWLAALETSVGEGTIGTYTIYARAHWLPFFGEQLAGVTTSRLGDYQRERLGKVKRATVIKEVTALRSFLLWCAEKELIAEAPLAPPLPAKAPGVDAAKRKKRATDVTPEEIARVLEAMPEYSTGKHGDFPVKAYFEVLWETGLRPSTVERLSCPEHFRRGVPELEITDEIDKARFGRTLPLTAKALAALESVCKGEGLLFGDHDWRDWPRRAAKVAGLPPHKVKTFTPYDFRHGRAVHLAETSDSLPGVAYLLGHKQLTTTDKYAKGKKRHAERVLSALAPLPPVRAFGCVSGASEGTGDRCEGGRVEVSQPDSLSVRRGGLEPPRCYPLAPQSAETHETGEKRGVVVPLERGFGGGGRALSGAPHPFERRGFGVVVPLRHGRSDWAQPWEDGPAGVNFATRIHEAARRIARRARR